MKLNLTNLEGGAAVERFDHELQRIVEDIRDPNTDPRAARSVTLKLTIKPQGDSREGVLHMIDVKAKLGGLRKIIGAAVLDDAGMYGADPRQTSLLDEAPDDPQVTPIDRSGTDD